MENKVKELSEKYVDYWAKHNITSRIGIFLFVFAYIFAIVFVMLHPVAPAIAQIVISTSAYIALLSVMSVVLGNNALVKIIEVIYGNKKVKKTLDDTIDNQNEKLPKLY